ncbi:MAG: hypothetical protein WA446_19710 [Steroidobacteraceae bacterium]
MPRTRKAFADRRAAGLAAAVETFARRRVRPVDLVLIVDAPRPDRAG